MPSVPHVGRGERAARRGLLAVSYTHLDVYKRQVLGEQIGNVLLAGARVDANDKLTLVCLAVPPVAFELAVVISEVKTIGKA